MLVANSHNLIVTVKPADQKNNVVPRGSRTTSSPNGQKNRLPARYWRTSHTWRSTLRSRLVLPLNANPGILSLPQQRGQ